MHVVDVACARFIGFEFVQLGGSWVGHDVVVDGESVIMQFRHSGDAELLGVRLPLPDLPLEGMSYRGIRMRTALDWFSDASITLTEEADTGVLLRSERVPRSGWTEVQMSFDPWRMEPSSGPMDDWGDYPQRRTPGVVMLSNDSITLAGGLAPKLSNGQLGRLVVDPDQVSIGSRTHPLATGNRIVGVRPRLWPLIDGWTFTFELSDDSWTALRFRTGGGLGVFLQQMAASPHWTVTRTRTKIEMEYRRE